MLNFDIMNKARKYGWVLALLITCFCMSFVVIAIDNDGSSDENSILTNIMVGVLILSLVLSIIVGILYYIEKRKIGRKEKKEFEFARQRQELELKKEKLEIEREHIDKLQFRACSRCGSRVPSDAPRCSSCGG